MNTSKIARISSEARQIDLVAALHSYVYHKNHCFYCGDTLDGHNRTKDHLIPKIRAYDGQKIIFRQKLSGMNLVHACHSCNNMKGCKSLFQFRQWVKQNKPGRHQVIVKNIDRVLLVPWPAKIRGLLLRAACLFI